MLNADFNAVQQAMVVAGNEFTAMGVSYAITQADIDLIQADIAANGLPGFEDNYLQSAGWSVAERQALADYLVNSDLNLGVASITIEQLIFETAGQMTVNCGGVDAIPTLPSWGLVAMIGLLLSAGVILIGRRGENVPSLAK